MTQREVNTVFKIGLILGGNPKISSEEIFLELKNRFNFSEEEKEETMKIIESVLE